MLLLQHGDGYPELGTPTLYKIFDRDLALLYVGVSEQFTNRMKRHMSAAWWPDVISISTETFATRGEAEDAELEAIRDRRPIHNSAIGTGRFGSTVRRR